MRLRTRPGRTELLTPTDGVYEFVYPTVVGPPKFEDSAFAVPAPDGQVRIEIVY